MFKLLFKIAMTETVKSALISATGCVLAAAAGAVLNNWDKFKKREAK